MNQISPSSLSANIDDIDVPFLKFAAEAKIEG